MMHLLGDYYVTLGLVRIALLSHATLTLVRLRRFVYYV